MMMMPHTLLLEALQSFLALADTLNLSLTERLTGQTRQTIRRHIETLERLRGQKLFKISKQKYMLTRAGKDAIPAAERLLSDAKQWVTGASVVTPSLEHFAHFMNDQSYAYLEQKALNDLFTGGGTFLKDCLLLWLRADGQIEQLKALRDYALVFRKEDEDWIIVEVGEKSSAAEWFGPTWHRSCIGQRTSKLPANDRMSVISNNALNTMGDKRSIRLDHICTLFPRQGFEQPQPHNGRRLMLMCSFEDKSPALVLIVQRTNDIQIANLPESLRVAMDASQEMAPSLDI